jgi:hypothetical protein
MRIAQSIGMYEDEVQRMERTELRGERFRGHEEVQDLTLAVVDALEEAELEEQREAVRQRILALPPERLFEIEPAVGTELWDVRFQPFVELTLHHILAVARNPKLSRAERRSEVDWALNMAGL